MKKGFFTIKDTNIVRSSIDDIVKVAQNRIQFIYDIERYQQLYGNIKITAEHSWGDSITYEFRDRSWNTLTDKLPEWSYPVLYQIALKESKITRKYTTPEELVARDCAAKTVKELELFFAKRQYKDYV
jgi:hypothetical protein